MREGGVSIDGGEIETFDLHGRILPSSLDHAFTYRAGQRLLDDLSLEPLLWWVPYESRPHDVWILRTSEEDGKGGGVSLCPHRAHRAEGEEITTGGCESEKGGGNGPSRRDDDAGEGFLSSSRLDSPRSSSSRCLSSPDACALAVAVAVAVAPYGMRRDTVASCTAAAAAAVAAAGAVAQSNSSPRSSRSWRPALVCQVSLRLLSSRELRSSLSPLSALT